MSNVKVADFIRSSASYMRADANNDGFISTSEARKLPVDLQDNFRNYKLYR